MHEQVFIGFESLLGSAEERPYIPRGKDCANPIHILFLQTKWMSQLTYGNTNFNAFVTLRRNRTSAVAPHPEVLCETAKTLVRLARADTWMADQKWIVQVEWSHDGEHNTLVCDQTCSSFPFCHPTQIRLRMNGLQFQSLGIAN